MNNKLVDTTREQIQTLQEQIHNLQVQLARLETASAGFVIKKDKIACVNNLAGQLERAVSRWFSPAVKHGLVYNQQKNLVPGTAFLQVRSDGEYADRGFYLNSPGAANPYSDQIEWTTVRDTWGTNVLVPVAVRDEVEGKKARAAESGEDELPF